MSWTLRWVQLNCILVLVLQKRNSFILCAFAASSVVDRDNIPAENELPLILPTGNPMQPASVWHSGISYLTLVRCRILLVQECQETGFSKQSPKVLTDLSQGQRRKKKIVWLFPWNRNLVKSVVNHTLKNFNFGSFLWQIHTYAVRCEGVGMKSDQLRTFNTHAEISLSASEKRPPQPGSDPHLLSRGHNALAL